MSRIFCGLAAYYVVRLGYYPVAIVNSSLITARSLNSEYLVAYQYYSRVLADKKEFDVQSLDFQKELRRAALNDLIENHLVYEELKVKIGNDLEGVVEGRIEISEADRLNLEEAAQVLYGLSLTNFKEIILVPRARREILEGRLSSEKKSLDGWLADASQSAKVFILTPEFFWDKNKVAVRD